MPSKVRCLDIYYRRRDRCKVTFPCPQCNTIMLSKEYVTHCKSCSHLDPTLQCVWCLGKMSWRKHTKGQHVNHLLSCWQKFIRSFTEPPVASPTIDSFVLESLEPMCPAQDMFGRTPLPELPLAAYEALFPFEADPLPVSFQNEGTRLAAGYVLKYLRLKSSYEFFHCQVRAVAFSSFLHCMEADQGRSQVLPFSCWCDGGKDLLARHRQHRHMIIASPEPGRFDRDVWNKISISKRDKPYKNYRCIYKRSLQTALHLVNAIGYCSKRASRCNGTCTENKKGKEKLNHFWIGTPLPSHFRLSCVLQWQGGIMELIHQNYRYKEPKVLVQASLQKIDGQWKIAVKDLPGIQLFLVLRVSPTFKPTAEEITEHFLHLHRNRKLYFKEDPSLDGLDRQAWGRIQAELGNCFYSIVAEELWTPCKFQQKCLNAIEPFRVVAAELQEALEKKNMEMAPLQKSLEHMNMENVQLQESLKQKDTEMAHLRESLEQKDREMAKLQESLITLYKSEGQRKDAENMRLKEIIEKLTLELDKQKNEKEFLLKQEIAQLKEEMVKLREESSKKRKIQIRGLAWSEENGKS